MPLIFTFFFSCSGTCKHVLATLFALAQFISGLEDRALVTCTDQPCVWNHSRKESKPVPVDKLDYRVKKEGPMKSRPTCATYHPIASHDSDHVRNKLLQALKRSTPRAVIHTSYNVNPAQPEPVKTAPTLSSLATDYRRQNGVPHISDLDHFEQYSRSALTADVRITISEFEQGSQQWKDQRKNRITASRAKQVVKFKSFQKAENSLARSINEGVDFDTKEMKHGRTWEPVARDMALDYLSDHSNVKCKQTGLIIDETTPYLAASPDGIISCDCHEDHVLEVKCTWKHWQSSWDQIISDSKYHISEDGLKKDSAWMWQIQTQMGASGLRCAYFAFLYSYGKKLYVEKINFHTEQWAQIQTKSREFFAKCVLPVLWRHPPCNLY